MVKLGSKFKKILHKTPKGIIRRNRALAKKKDAQALADDRRITAFDELPARSLAHINVDTASIATSTDDRGGKSLPMTVHTNRDGSQGGTNNEASSEKRQKHVKKEQKAHMAQQKNLQRNVELARASEHVFGRDLTVVLGNTVAGVTKGMAKGLGWVLRDPYFHQRNELRNLHPITMTVSARVHRLSFVHPAVDLNSVQRKAESMKNGKKKRSSTSGVSGTGDSATAAAALERWTEMIKEEQFRLSRDGIVADHYQRQHQEEQRLRRRERQARRHSSYNSPRTGNYGHQTRRKRVRVKGVRRVIASRTSSMANSSAFRGANSSIVDGSFAKRKPTGSETFKNYNNNLNPKSKSKSKPRKISNRLSLTGGTKSKVKKLSQYVPEDGAAASRAKGSKSKRDALAASEVAPFSSFYDSGDFSGTGLSTATLDGEHANHTSGECDGDGENGEDEYWSDDDGDDADGGQNGRDAKTRNNSTQSTNGYSSKMNWAEVLSYVSKDGLAFAGGVLQDWSVARIGRYLPEIACRVPHSAICFDLKNNRHKTKGTQPFVVESPNVLWGSGRDPLLLKVAQEGSPFLDSRPLEFKSDFDLLHTEQSESLLLTTSTLFVDYPPANKVIPTFREQQQQNANQAEEAARRAAAKLRTYNPVDGISPHKKMSVIGEESVQHDNEEDQGEHKHQEDHVAQMKPSSMQRTQSSYTASSDAPQMNNHCTPTSSLGDSSVRIGDIDAVPRSSMSSPTFLRKEDVSVKENEQVLHTPLIDDNRQQFSQYDKEQRGSVKRPASVVSSVASRATSTSGSTVKGSALDAQVESLTREGGSSQHGPRQNDLTKLPNKSKPKRRRTISAEEEMEMIGRYSRSGSTEDDQDIYDHHAAVRSESCPISMTPNESLSFDRSMKFEGIPSDMRDDDDNMQSFETATTEMLDGANASSARTSRVNDKQSTTILMNNQQTPEATDDDMSTSMPTTIEEARKMYPNLFVVESTPTGDVMSRYNSSDNDEKEAPSAKSIPQNVERFELKTPTNAERSNNAMNSSDVESSTPNFSINGDESGHERKLSHFASDVFPKGLSSGEGSFPNWYKWRSDSCPPEISGDSNTNNKSCPPVTSDDDEIGQRIGASRSIPIHRELSLPQPTSTVTSTSSVTAKRAMSVPASFQDISHNDYEVNNNVASRLDDTDNIALSFAMTPPAAVLSSSVPPSVTTHLPTNERALSLPVMNNKKGEGSIGKEKADSLAVSYPWMGPDIQQKNIDKKISTSSDGGSESVMSSPSSQASSTFEDSQDMKKKKAKMKAVVLAVGKFRKKQGRKEQKQRSVESTDNNSKRFSSSMSQNSTASSSGKAVGALTGIDEEVYITDDEANAVEEILPLNAEAQSHLRSQQQSSHDPFSITFDTGNSTRKGANVFPGDYQIRNKEIYYNAEAAKNNEEGATSSFEGGNRQKSGNVTVGSPVRSWSLKSSSSSSSFSRADKTKVDQTSVLLPTGIESAQERNNKLASSLNSQLFKSARDREEIDKPMMPSSPDEFEKNSSGLVASSNEGYLANIDSSRPTSSSLTGASTNGSASEQRSTNDFINMGSISIIEDDNSSTISATASSLISSAASGSKRRKAPVAVPDTIVESSHTLDVEPLRDRDSFPTDFAQDLSSADAHRGHREADRGIMNHSTAASLSMPSDADSGGQEIGVQSDVTSDPQTQQEPSVVPSPGQEGIVTSLPDLYVHDETESASHTTPSHPRLSTFEVEVNDVPGREDIMDSGSVKSKSSLRKSIAARFASPKKTKSKQKTETNDPAPYVLVLDEIIQFRVMGFPSSKVLATFPISVASILAERSMHDRLHDPSIPSELTLTLVQEPKASEGRWGVEATVTFRCVIRDTRSEKKPASIGNGKRGATDGAVPTPSPMVLERSHSVDLLDTVETRKFDIAAHEEGTSLVSPRFSQSCRNLLNQRATKNNGKDMMPQSPDDFMQRQMFYDPQVTKMDDAKKAGQGENGLEWMNQNQNSQSTLNTDWNNSTANIPSRVPPFQRLSFFDAPTINHGQDLVESSRSLNFPNTPGTVGDSPGDDMHWAMGEMEDTSGGPAPWRLQEHDWQQDELSGNETVKQKHEIRVASLEDLDIKMPSSSVSSVLPQRSGIEEQSGKEESGTSSGQSDVLQVGGEGAIQPLLPENRIASNAGTDSSAIAMDSAETNRSNTSRAGSIKSPPRQRSRQVSFTDQALPFRPRTISEQSREQMIGQEDLLLQESSYEEDAIMGGGSREMKRKEATAPGFLASFIGQDMATTVLGPGEVQKNRHRVTGSDVTASLHRSLMRNAALTDSSASLGLDNDEDEKAEPLNLIMNADAANDGNAHFASLVKNSLKKSGMNQSFYHSTADMMATSLPQNGVRPDGYEVFRGYETGSDDGTGDENDLFLSPSDLGLRSFPSSEDEDVHDSNDIFWSTKQEGLDERPTDINEGNLQNDGGNGEDFREDNRNGSQIDTLSNNSRTGHFFFR